MATTTNYGWETPDDTDLVKDGAAAIRTLGSSVDTTTKNLNPQTTTGALAYRSATANVNTALPIGTAGQILAVSGGVPAWINNDQGDITEVQAGTGISVASGTGPIPVVTNTVATEFDAKGDLVVGTGSDTFDRLAVGTNTYILTADSAEATGLKWAAPAPSGKVLQVVSVTKTDSFTAAAGVGNWSDVTGLAATITPTLATSKVLMLYNVSASQQVAFNVCHSQVLRGATVINLGDAAGSRVRSTSDPISAAGALIGTTIAGTFLDSPATTSATTYKWQVMANGGTVYVNRSETDGNSVDYARTISTITLMEIGA